MNYSKKYYEENKYSINKKARQKYKKYFGPESKRKKLLQQKNEMKKLKELLNDYCGGNF